MAQAESYTQPAQMHRKSSVVLRACGHASSALQTSRPRSTTPSRWQMDAPDSAELLRAAVELKQLEGYLHRVPSTSVPSQNTSEADLEARSAMDTSSRDKRGTLEAQEEETRQKYPKASGKGNQTSGEPSTAFGPAQPLMSSQEPRTTAEAADKGEEKHQHRSLVLLH